MPPSQPPLPPPPQPTRQIFDPFNSSSTGHQRDANRLSGSTSWRASRTHKLSHQLRDTSGRGGPQHLSDLVGAGSANFGLDGWKENGDWEKGAPGLREDGWRDIRDMMQGPRKRTSSSRSSEEALTEGPATKKTTNNKKVKRDDGTMSRHVTTGEGLQYWQGRLSTNKTLISTAAEYNPNLKKKTSSVDPTSTKPPSTTDPEDLDDNGPDASAPASSLSRTTAAVTPRPPPPPPQIFSGLTIYLNGSTHPHISDHKLKHVLAQHGANVSIALGRRTVTHVILGDKGGLAAGKIQKEVAGTRTNGAKGVKFVGVRWALDSVERGKRQPESRYEVVRLAMRGQRSVLAMGMGDTGVSSETPDEITGQR